MKKIKNIWHLVLINGIFDLVFILLFSWVVMYADDYYYASFFKNGISSFISMNIDHYQTFNGRVLVHILAEIVLACKPVLFPLANIAMIFKKFYKIVFLRIFFNFFR